jgi:hypothetical protein
MISILHKAHETLHVVLGASLRTGVAVIYMGERLAYAIRCKSSHELGFLCDATRQDFGIQREVTPGSRQLKSGAGKHQKV